MRILLAFLISVSAQAATYYVRTDGNNANAGTSYTSGGAWITLTYAVAHVTAGDTIRVGPGTYNEQPTVSIDGSAGNVITCMAYDVANKPVCRGFYLSGLSYWRFIGFEITHTTTSYFGAFQMQSCDHIEIIDNYIHHALGRASGEGAVVADIHSSPSSYVTIRGNTFYYLGFQSGVFNHSNVAAINSDYPSSHHWLVEYNTIQRSGDYLYMYGNHHIVRNNYMFDCGDYWVGSPDGTIHTDYFQQGSDGVTANTSYMLIDANFCWDNNLGDGHFYLQQNNPGAGSDTDHVVRGNIVTVLGSGAIANMNTANFLAHNNTLHDMVNVAADGMTYRQWGANSPSGCVFANNIIADDGNGTDAISIESGSCSVVTNIGYLAGSEAGYISTSDPQFVNAGTLDFRLGASSPARNTGTAFVYITTSAGSGTSFTVNNGKFLSDGMGIADGDVVSIGGTSVRVSSVSGNSVTVSSSVTWGTSERVYINGDTTPDIGALPYESTELTAATIANVGTTYTVTPTGDCRGVWFYVDGVPTTWDSSSPYQATIASGTVTAKAYSLWAQTTPVVSASAVDANPKGYKQQQIIGVGVGL